MNILGKEGFTKFCNLLKEQTSKLIPRTRLNEFLVLSDDKDNLMSYGSDGGFYYSSTDPAKNQYEYSLNNKSLTINSISEVGNQVKYSFFNDDLIIEPTIKGDPIIFSFDGDDLIIEKEESNEKMPSYVGMIIHSYTLSTEEEVKNIYGGNEWSKIENRFLIGASETYVNGSTGGSETVTLVSNNIPAHYHSVPTLSAYTSTNGNHCHTFTANPSTSSAGRGGSQINYVNNYQRTVNNAGAHSHSLSIPNNAVAAGKTTGASPVSIINKYESVYIWERML